MSARASFSWPRARSEVTEADDLAWRAYKSMQSVAEGRSRCVIAYKAKIEFD